MCRWAAYIGQEIYLEDIITRPNHSLIAQSQQAEECKTATNGDGFGVAWYGDRDVPGLYRDTYPAWADPNLASVAQQVKSGLFLSHVRATTGSAISRNNCHPFTCKNWSFMHNGQFGGFETFRKHADMAIPDALYGERRGATDSEAFFLIALGYGMVVDPIPAILKAALFMRDLSIEQGAAPHMRISAAFSDGDHLYAMRLSSDHIAPTLYYRWSKSRKGFAVVSEPLELDEDGWSLLEPGHVAIFGRAGPEDVRIVKLT